MICSVTIQFEVAIFEGFVNINIKTYLVICSVYVFIKKKLHKVFIQLAGSHNTISDICQSTN